MTTSDFVYVFRSITQMTIGDSAVMQQLRPSASWMLISLSGSGIVQTQHQRHPYMLSAKAALISYEETDTVALQAEPGTGPWKLYCVEFAKSGYAVADEPAATEEEAQRREASIIVADGGKLDELFAMADRLHSAAHMLHDRQERMLWVQLIMQQILLWWHTSANRPVGQRTTEQAVREVQHEMELRYNEGWSRDEQAARAGVAAAYFSVLFKRLTGAKPSVYLDRLRVHRAAELLLQERGQKGDLADIAQQVGYRDAWYLSKRFRGVLGMGPSRFREQFVPQRVASLQYPYTHHLLALGVVPKLARLGSYPHAHAAQLCGESTVMPALLTMEAQKQVLLNHRPDLIISYDMEEMRAKWRQAAPVAYIPWLGLDWRDHMRTIASLFAREEQAAACMKAIDRQAGEIRQRLLSATDIQTVSIFKIVNQRCFLYGVRDVGCIFYELLGFQPPDPIRQRLSKEPNLHSMEITLQQLVDCVADLNVLILVPDQEEHLQRLWTNEHWRAFELAASPRLLYLDHREWLHYDPINFVAQLQIVEERIRAVHP